MPFLEVTAMYSKLALRNVRKSFRDYAIYFLTLMFGVCIFYVFNSIDSQQSMMVITASQLESLERLQDIMNIFSVFVAFILGFLIIYANRFLVRRRSKELAIYQILGMEKRKISRILIIETALVAVTSLAAGLVLGVFISQGFAVLTASLFEVKLVGFTFIFSSAAAIKSIYYFGIAFLLVMLFNRISVSRQKLINLLYAERKNEKLKIPHLVLSVIVFVVSAAALGFAYYLVEKNGASIYDEALIAAILLGFVGTFLFFFSLSGFFLKVVQQNKKVYFKGLNMFVLRQINSKINTAFMSISMVCLLLFLSICSLSFGIGFASSITNDMERLHPYDATLEMFIKENVMIDERSGEMEYKSIPIDLIDEFNRVKTPVNSYAKQMVAVALREVLVDYETTDGYFAGDFMTLSDYNQLLEMQGKPPVTLGENEFIFNGLDETRANDYLNYFSKNKVSLLGAALSLKAVDDTPLYNTQSKANYSNIHVLPDKLLADADVLSNLLAVNYIESNRQYNDLYTAAFQEVFENVEKASGSSEKQFMTNNAIKIDNFENSKSVSVTIAYLAVYLGIVFSVIAAVILAITQLSEASDNSHRYGLLRKLGTDKKMINKALFRQIAIYFGVPLLLAAVHSIFGIRFVNELILQVGKTSVLRDILITVGVQVVIYGGYFSATYFGSKRIIGNK